MSGSIITSKGRARFAECAAVNQPLNIAHFVFADIPGNVDPGSPPESLTALPGTEVYRCPVLKRGKLTEDAVVYSVMIGASVGSFMLNAMGLLDSTGALIAVSYFPRQTKTAASGTVAGNVLSKNFTIRFPNVSTVTGISVDPECWMVPDVFPASTFAPKNHTHAIAEVNGLSTSLAGKAPSNHTHAASQITDLPAILAPYARALPGEIKAYAGTTVPTGYLECNGAEVSRAAYPELLNIIGTAFGSPVDVTKFKLPDLRGEFIRGWDHGRGIDANRALGSLQSDAVQAGGSHVLNKSGSFVFTSGGDTLFALRVLLANGAFSSSQYNGWKSGGLNGGYAGHNNQINWAISETISRDGSRRTAAETRPRNIALMYIIKY